MLPYGINPEELMLDLAKKLDEDRRDAAAALEASFAAPLAEDRLGLEDLLLEELALDEPPPRSAPQPAPGGRARGAARGRRARGAAASWASGSRSRLRRAAGF